MGLPSLVYVVAVEQKQWPEVIVSPQPWLCQMP